MAKQQIIVKINKGIVQIDAVGFKGNACKKATEAFEEALGDKISDSDKDELFDQETECVQNVGY